MPARRQPDCNTCLGTGQVLLLNSMFLGDGYRRERCAICGGSGKSSFHAHREDVAWQRQARLRDAAMRKAPKGLSFIELGRIASTAA